MLGWPFPKARLIETAAAYEKVSPPRAVSKTMPPLPWGCDCFLRPHETTAARAARAAPPAAVTQTTGASGTPSDRLRRSRRRDGSAAPPLDRESAPAPPAPAGRHEFASCSRRLRRHREAPGRATID